MDDIPTVNSFRLCISVFAITLSRFIFGYDRGAIGGASLGLVQSKILSNNQYATLVSLPMFASVVGGLFGSCVQHRVGRNRSLLLSTVAYAVGVVLCVSSARPRYYTLLLGRTLSNLSFGMGHVTSLVYLVELTPQDSRGKVLVLNQMMQPIGNSVAGLANLAISRFGNDWRLMLGLSAVPGVLQFVLLHAVPSSFTWLSSKGQSERAWTEARKLYRSLSDVAFKTLVPLIPSSNRFKKGKLDTPVLRRMVIMSLALITFGQLSGFSAIMFYSVQVAHTAGLGKSSTDLFLVSEGVFLSNVIGVIWSLCVIDQLGRRRTLLASQAGTVLSLLAVILSVNLVDLSNDNYVPIPDYVSEDCRATQCISCIASPHCGFCFFNTSTGSTEGYCLEAAAAGHSLLDRCEIAGGSFQSSYCPSQSNYMLLIAMAAFVIFFSLGLAPVPFMYASEIFPQRYRDLLTGLSISTYYTLTALVNLAFGVLYPILGISNMFMVFLVITFAGFLFTLIFAPEISGRSPETIHLLFREPWFKCGGSSDVVQQTDYSIVTDD